MANIEKPIWSVDGQTLTNVLVNNKSTTYNKVSNWYDGTPMDDSKLDDDFVYVKYEGEYLVRNLEYGQVLQKDAMQQMRDLSSYEILLLKMGVYKHVQLNGYYEKGDTPEPINYILSDTTDEDDGGSVIDISNGIKLEHKFFSYTHSSYFGVIESDSPVDTRDKIQNMFDSSSKYNTEEVVIGAGEFVIIPFVEYINSGSTLVFKGSLKLEDNSISGETQLIKYSSSNITVINQKLDGNRDNNTSNNSRGTICSFTSYGESNQIFKGGWVKNSTQSHMHCTSENTSLESIEFSNSGEHCIYMTTVSGSRPAQYLKVQGCTFIGWGFSFSSSAITVRDVRKVDVLECMFDPTYIEKGEDSQSTIAYMGNYRHPIQDELLYMKVDKCIFKRGKGNPVAANFSIRDFDEGDELKTDYYLNKGYGIHIYNSIIEQHSFNRVFKIKDSIISPTFTSYISQIPSILENNIIYHNRGIRPYDLRYKTLKISNNTFIGNPEETFESSAIDLHNSDYKGTVIVSENVFTEYNVPTNIGLIRNSISGVSNAIITKNSFVDCGQIYTIRLNGVTGLVEGNIDLSGTTRGIRFGDTFQSEYVKNNSNIKEYGDTSDRPGVNQLYEGLTYYNTDSNKIEIYSNGEWDSLTIPSSQDIAPTIGDNFDKSEVQSILDELRDLKTKMRTAGLLEE